MPRDPFTPKYQRTPSGAKAAWTGATADERKLMSQYQPEALTRRFGSKGFQPVRNQKFQSQSGFNAWKARNKKSKYDYQEVDIDGDTIPEAVVWEDSTHQTPVAVNGWALKGSKHRLYMTPNGRGGYDNYWEGEAQHMNQHIDENFKYSLSAILGKFGKHVVKIAYDLLFPKGDPANDAFRKQFGYSKFTRKVANLLVGDALDQEMLNERADQIRAAGYSDTNPDDVKTVMSMLHKRKEYKAALETRLFAYAEAFNAGNEGALAKVQHAIRSLIPGNFQQ